jgi:hypothetical protein
MDRAENASTAACELVEEVVRTFGHARFRAFGTSMVPSILPGDLVSVQRAGFSEISTGDVVVYSREGRLFAHRAVGLSGDTSDPRLIARGDRLCDNDAPISSTALLGRVTSIERADGRGFRPVHLARRNGWAKCIVRVLQVSDLATNCYVRLAGLWSSFVGRTFRSDVKIVQAGGLLSPDAPGAKAHAPSAGNIGAETPTHKAKELSIPVLRNQDRQGAFECQA